MNRIKQLRNEGAFKTFRYFGISADLTELQDDNPEWHKVVED